MKIQTAFLISALFGLAACGQQASAEQSMRDGAALTTSSKFLRTEGRLRDQYIVVLDDSAPGVKKERAESLAAELVAQHGGQRLATFDDSFRRATPADQLRGPGMDPPGQQDEVGVQGRPWRTGGA